MLLEHPETEITVTKKVIVGMAEEESGYTLGLNTKKYCKYKDR